MIEHSNTINEGGDFGIEMERTYRLSERFVIPYHKDGFEHIRQSHLYESTDVKGLVEWVAIKIHNTIHKLELTDDDFDQYIMLLLSIVERVEEKFSDTENYTSYKMRVRVKDRSEWILTVKWKRKDSSDETKIHGELNIIIPIRYAVFLLTKIWVPPPEIIISKKSNKAQWIIKTRHRILGKDGKTWQLDRYLGRNSGLVTAEVELWSPEEQVALLDPGMIQIRGTDAKPFNVKNLQMYPYGEWSDEERIRFQNPSPVQVHHAH